MKRDRPINITEETAKAPAISHVPHPFDAALGRAGSDGNMSEVYILRFVSYRIRIS